MISSLDLWIEYLIRFSHLVAGIAWIGSSFYFIWLDSSFLPPETPRKNVEGEVFMVHGGFYYQVEKKKIYPGELPKILHWFKWEATLTWITGFLLLIVLYYMKGASFLIDSYINPMTQTEAILMSLGILVGAWLVYDFIWQNPWLSHKSVRLLLSVLFFSGLIYLNFNTFSGRGAFIQTGVIFGTMMILNVWIRILPGQKKMLKEAEAGLVPDYSVSLKSKTRSVHNTYFTFPVLFIMLSNHYASIYNHPKNWLLLIVLSISGAMVRHTMVTKNKLERWLLLPAALGLAALVFITSKTYNVELSQFQSKKSAYEDPHAGLGLNIPSTKNSQDGNLQEQTNSNNLNNEEVITYETIQPIVAARCLSCHSTKPTDDIFKEPPKGLILETEFQLIKARDIIYHQVIESRVMPFVNKTNMTEEERILLGKWLKL